MKKRTNIFLRCFALILVLALMTPTAAMAATQPEIQPLAADYIATADAYMTAEGDGKVRVYFSVYGMQTLAELGVVSIVVQRYHINARNSFVNYQVYRYENYPELMGHNTMVHGGYVEFQGTPYTVYRAYVSFRATKNGEIDTQNLMCDPVQAR